jgi:hypothetical protein
MESKRAVVNALASHKTEDVIFISILLNPVLESVLNPVLESVLNPVLNPVLESVLESISMLESMLQSILESKQTGLALQQQLIDRIRPQSSRGAKELGY